MTFLNESSVPAVADEGGGIEVPSACDQFLFSGNRNCQDAVASCAHGCRRICGKEFRRGRGNRALEGGGLGAGTALQCQDSLFGSRIVEHGYLVAGLPQYGKAVDISLCSLLGTCAESAFTHFPGAEFRHLLPVVAGSRQECCRQGGDNISEYFHIFYRLIVPSSVQFSFVRILVAFSLGLHPRIWP